VRAIVVRDPSLEGDLANYRRYLPDKEFFRDTHSAVPCVDKTLQAWEDRARGEDGKPCLTPSASVGDPPKGTP